MSLILSSLWSIKSIRSCNWRINIFIISENIVNCSWRHLQIKLSIKRWMQAITTVEWAGSSGFFFVSFSLIWLLSCDIITVMWSKFNHLQIKLNSYKVCMNWTSRLLCSICMNQTLSMFDSIWFNRSSICSTYTVILEPWSSLIVRPADSMDSYTVSRSSRCWGSVRIICRQAKSSYSGLAGRIRGIGVLYTTGVTRPTA